MDPQATAEFDRLRREATKLERHLEERVGRYQQVCDGFASYDMFGVHLFVALRFISCMKNEATL